MLLRVNFPLDNRSYVVRVLGEVVMSASVLSQKSIDSKLHSHPCETGCVEQDEMKGDTYHTSVNVDTIVLGTSTEMWSYTSRHIRKVRR